MKNAIRKDRKFKTDNSAHSVEHTVLSGKTDFGSAQKRFNSRQELGFREFNCETD